MKHEINTIKCDFVIANYKTAKRTHEQMVEYYNSLDLFIHTGKYHLSTPNPYFEAASCGIATIGTTNGCIPFLTTEYKNGITIDINKSDEEKAKFFIDTIKYLQMDKKINGNKCLSNKMGIENRKEILNNWSWGKKAKCWIELFN